MASNSILDVCGVSHRYAQNWAVQDIEFKIESPGIFGLLGSNGAGKSTIMNIICGALYASQGDVLIHGHSIRREPQLAKQHLGFLPQQAPLHLDFTVDEYLHYCAELRGVSPVAKNKLIEEAKGKVGVTRFSKRLIGALSGGYRQRVGIAGATLHKPRLVVFDEPTNGLDPVQVREVRKLIRDIAEERAVLISTHVMSEVEALCDEIKMIEGGRVVFEGGVDDYLSIIKSNAIVARFESPPDLGALESIQGVLEVHPSPAGTGKVKLMVDGDPDDVCRSLIGLCLEKKCGLIEVSIEKSELEQVFASFYQRTITGLH